jgi:Sulfotransferase domain
MAGRLPTFLIVGAMRSGTTSLARYLGEHPDVYVAAEKEVHFFDRHWDRGLDWYRERFAAAGGARAVGEATPAYLYEEPALRRISEVLPDVRLLVVLRNPVDRAYSHYWLERGLGRERRSFADAVADGSPDPERDYLAWSRYLPQLELVTRYVPRGSLLVLLFEDLVEDPRSAFRTACGFLGVDRDFVPGNLGRDINRYRDYRSLRLRMYARRPPSTLLKRALARLNTVPHSSYPPMDPETRARLVPAFRESNRALGRWLGSDVSVWEG